MKMIREKLQQTWQKARRLPYETIPGTLAYERAEFYNQMRIALRDGRFKIYEGTTLEEQREFDKKIYD